ncbi:MAG: hypothetical protein Q9187_001523 [Circinaria calcarea]
MERIRKNLKEALVKSAESKYFLTEGALNSILTRDTVRECIEKTEIDMLWKRNCMEAVFNGGKRVLALLIMRNRVDLIVKFVETDQSSKTGHLDSRLPFEQETLTRILMNDNDAIFDIQRHQWEVIAPYFEEGRAHRIYQTDIVIPFVKSKWIGGGGFGDVYEVTLPSTHHGFGFQGGDQVRDSRHSICISNTLQVTIVRKLLRFETDAHGGRLLEQAHREFKSEQRILSLLKSLRHENIIELLASYTVLNDPPEHNFLFPRADATLSKVLRDKERDALSVFFPFEHALLQQLYGLSSAIENLHQYCSKEYDLELIGCHYDLAPRNILIRQRKLLLADFGLSRLRPETSKTIFAAGNGDYLAPECEPLQDDTFSKGIVGRASDIWSFGCILLEILIHNLHPENKAQAVEDFQKKRRTTLWAGEYTAYLFHSHDKPNPAVTGMLDSLSNQITNIQQKHLLLIRDMLAFNPDSRPTADSVTIQIFLRAQETIVKTVCRVFEATREFWLDDTLLDIERKRFILWGWSAKLLEDYSGFEVPASLRNDSLRQWLLGSRQVFAEIHKLLLAFLSEVNLIKENKELTRKFWKKRDIVHSAKQHVLPATEIHRRQLSLLNDGLWALPPRPLVHMMNGLLENQILSANNVYTLGKLHDLDEGSLSRNLTLLSTIKYLTARVHQFQPNARKRLLLTDHQVPVSTKLGIHCFGTISEMEGVEKTVLIEQMSYDPDWLGQHHGDELYNRADALAELLNNPEMPDYFRVLQCTGYFLDLSHNAISLVYGFPPLFSLSLKPVSLKSLILGCQRPNLGTLFNLAQSLARCVLAVHKTGWLHKNISSLNVLFFDNELSQAYVAVTNTSEKKLQPAPPIRDEKHILPSPRQIGKKKLSKNIFNAFSRKARDRRLDSQPLASTSETASSASLVTSQHSAKAEGDSQREPIKEVEHIDLSRALQQPFLVGFDHSRPDKEIEFTSGPSREQSQKPYQHPKHRDSHSMRRYHPEFDYYSMGVVLLELGLWRPVEVIVQADRADRLPENTNPNWLLDVVPQLGSTMGAVYRDAVKTCLNGELASLDSGLRPMELFEILVANGIERCYA